MAGIKSCDTVIALLCVASFPGSRNDRLVSAVMRMHVIIVIIIRQLDIPQLFGFN